MNKILKILSILVIGFVMFSCSTPTNDPTPYVPEPSGPETPVEQTYPVGSSAKISSGLFTRLLATETLCRSPPESSEGKCDILSFKPTAHKSSSAFSIAYFLETPAINAGRKTFSNAVKSFKR